MSRPATTTARTPEACSSSAGRYASQGVNSASETSTRVSSTWVRTQPTTRATTASTTSPPPADTTKPKPTSQTLTPPASSAADRVRWGDDRAEGEAGGDRADRHDDQREPHDGQGDLHRRILSAARWGATGQG